MPRHQSHYLNNSFDFTTLRNQKVDENLQKSMTQVDETFGSDDPSSPKQQGKPSGVRCLGDFPNNGAATKWMPNEQSDQCIMCEKAFNVFRRKHHCRSCGALVCSKCSPDKHYVHGYKDQKVRICLRCAEVREKRQKELKDRGVFLSENNTKGKAAIRASSVSITRATNDL